MMPEYPPYNKGPALHEHYAQVGNSVVNDNWQFLGWALLTRSKGRFAHIGKSPPALTSARSFSSSTIVVLTRHAGLSKRGACRVGVAK